MQNHPSNYFFARPNIVGVYRRKSQYEYEITDESTWQEVIFGLLSTVKSQDIVVMSSGRDQSSRPNVLT